jgi:hypothetical protein
MELVNWECTLWSAAGLHKCDSSLLTHQLAETCDDDDEFMYKEA